MFYVELADLIHLRPLGMGIWSWLFWCTTAWCIILSCCFRYSETKKESDRLIRFMWRLWSVGFGIIVCYLYWYEGRYN